MTAKERTNIIGGRQLAALIRFREADLQDLAQEQRLPFSVSAHGFYIQRRDLDQWKAVAKSFREKNALSTR
jgi:hypothetical protein